MSTKPPCMKLKPSKLTTASAGFSQIHRTSVFVGFSFFSFFFVAESNLSSQLGKQSNEFVAAQIFHPTLCSYKLSRFSIKALDMRYYRIISQSLSRHCTNTFQNPKFLPKNLPFSTSCTHISINPHISCSRIQPWNYMNFVREYTSSAQDSKPGPSERVSAIVDEISGLTLLEVADLTEVLRKKLDINEMPVMAVMMPGMGFGVKGAAKGGGAAKGEEKKAEKTAFDLKLEGGFDAGVKIKIIKEVRACTDLGLKEAKDLVEKAPTLLKKGVTKEEAEKIIEKMKEVGAKVTME